MQWGHALAVVGMLGCAGQPPAAPETTAVEETIRISGAETLTMALLPSLAEAFERTHPGVSFEIDAGGSGKGLRALLDGDAEMAASSRPPHPAEREQARALGMELRSKDHEHLVAVDVVAVAVHKDSALREISYDQVIGVFCTGEISDWSQLGMEPGPIRPLTRSPSSGTRAIFEDFFCGPDGIDTYIEQVSAAEIGEALLDDPRAIAYVSMSEARGTLLALRPGTADRAVAPTQQNMLRGAYPLSRDLYVYTGKDVSEQVREFLDFARSPAGQEVVDEERFVPLFLRPERLDEPRPLREVVHFEQDSDRPTSRSLARLEVLVQDLGDRTTEARHIILEGYTDNREPDALALGKARAFAVQKLLEDRLPGLYFEIIPRGAELPIAPNSTPYGRQQNRRVQVYLAAEESFEPILSGNEAKVEEMAEEAEGEPEEEASG